MDKATHDKPALTPEQQAAHAAIRARAQRERPGPDELIDQGELDELVPHGQFMELRMLTAQFRRMREEQGLSLTDVSERSGLTRAAISRLENGWNLNPTLDTLFRYAAALGSQVTLSVSTTTDHPSTER
jgi:DNA-binding XRE family transcriptional regulator